MGWSEDKYVFRSYVSLTGQKPRTNCIWQSCKMYGRTSLFDKHIQLTTSIDNTKHSVRPTVSDQYWRQPRWHEQWRGFLRGHSIDGKSQKRQSTFSLHSWCVISSLSARCFMIFRPQGLTAVLTDVRGLGTVWHLGKYIDTILLFVH